MAIVYSYPTTQASDLSNSDLLLLSKMDENGRPTKSVTLSSLAAYIGSGSGIGGPFLPLSAGPTVPLTGDLYMAPNGAVPSVGSKNIVFRGIDDTGAELTSAKIFTLDSTINPSGQDLYFQNADDAGVLQTGLFIDAFQQVAIAKSSASAQLDVGGSFNVDGNVIFSGYGGGTKTGVAAYSLAVTATGLVIEEPTSSGVPWPYQYDAGDGILMQGENPGATGLNNTTLGVGAGVSLTSGGANTLIGKEAGKRLNQGGSHVAVGFQALANEVNTSGGSVAVGYDALRFQNGVGSTVFNTAVGATAGRNISSGNANTLLGYSAGGNLTGGGGNICIGYNVNASSPSANNETTIGGQFLRMPSLSSGASNGDVMTYSSATGYISLSPVTLPWDYEYDAANENFVQGEAPNIVGTGNTGYGVGSLPILDAGNNNTAFGANTGFNLENSSDNVMIGYDAGRNFRPGGSTCDRNTVVGSGIRFAVNPQGDDNTCVGYRAGSNIDSGSFNVFIGSDSGRINTLGTDNVAIGRRSLETNSGSSRNIAIGSLALTAAQTNSANNTAIGYEAGTAITNGDNNVLLGYGAGRTITSGNNNLVIGYAAQSSSATVNNEITIGNNSHNNIRLPGSLPAFDDDAAAGAGGLLTNMLYQTTGAGVAPLNVAGIVMIKQ